MSMRPKLPLHYAAAEQEFWRILLLVVCLLALATGRSAGGERLFARGISAPDLKTNNLSAGAMRSSGPQQPFWRYTAFGSGIGGSNIVVIPGVAGAAPELAIGGQSNGGYAANDFWQVIQWNPATANYDQIFVTALYPAAIRRIALGDVVGDSRQEIVVIHFYDAASRAHLGQFASGAQGGEGLSLSDLDGDGRPELIVTTVDDLFVFNGQGELSGRCRGPAVMKWWRASG